MNEQPQRREDPRYRLPYALGAEMAFDGPDGTRHRYDLINISIRGASFFLPERRRGIQQGAMLLNAVILVDDLEIQGNVAVLHATPRLRQSFSCGVQFYPKTDFDQNQLVSFVSRLDAQEQPRN